MDSADDHEKRIKLVRSKIRPYRDFPKEGVVFEDIFSVFADREAFTALMELLQEKGRSLVGKADVVVGVDARGFLMGPIIALAAGMPFVPLRKKGKLPGAVESTTYSLEYGEATLEVQKNAIAPNAKVVIVDDLLATGGSLNAACGLMEQLGQGISVVECFVVVELCYLRGRDNLRSKTPLFNSLVQFH